MKKIEIDPKEIMFPAPLEVWVGSYELCRYKKAPIKVFPAPLEVWMVSYGADADGCYGTQWFPASLKVWGVSYYGLCW